MYIFHPHPLCQKGCQCCLCCLLGLLGSPGLWLLQPLPGLQVLPLLLRLLVSWAMMLLQGPGVTGTAAAVGVIEVVDTTAIAPAILSLLHWFSCLHEVQLLHLQMYRCMDLSSILVCCTEKTLLGYGCPTGYKLKGRDKGMIHITLMLMVLSISWLQQATQQVNAYFPN